MNTEQPSGSHSPADPYTSPATAPDLPSTRGPLNPHEKTWALMGHLSSLSAFIGVPFGHILGPLICWQVSKHDRPFAAEESKEALNFGLSLTIYYIVAAILFLIVIGIILLPLLAVAHLVLSIIAGIRANEGQSYRYPFTIRFIK